MASSLQRHNDFPRAGTLRPLRIAVCIEAAMWPDRVQRTLADLGEVPYVQLAAVILSSRSSGRRNAHPIASLCTSIDRALFGDKSRRQESMFSRHSDVPTFKVTTTRAAEGTTWSEFDIARLRALDLDVLIDLGAGDLHDEISHCTRYGVWWFESNLPDESDSDSLLAWYGERTVPEMSLLSKQPGKSAPRLLYRSTLMGHPTSLIRTRKSESDARLSVLLSSLAQLHTTGRLVTAQMSKSECRSRHSRATLHGSVRWVPRLTKAFAEHLLEPRWVLAYRSRLSDSAKFRVIAGTGGFNYADPFLFERDGRHFLFFEAWQNGHHGVIRCVELRDDGHTDPVTVLARPYHLSYPHVFEWKGEMYMIPETAGNGTIELYRALDFPWRWELDCVLMENTSAVDSTVFELAGKLWLFTAGITGPELRTSELSLFYADSLRGPWAPHALNPIVCDVRRARPAGPLFSLNGRLFRPGQDSSQQYGYAVSLNRIDELSETAYRETPVATIKPDWLPGITATHTLVRDSRYEVRDAKASFWRSLRG